MLLVKHGMQRKESYLHLQSLRILRNDPHRKEHSSSLGAAYLEEWW